MAIVTLYCFVSWATPAYVRISEEPDDRHDSKIRAVGTLNSAVILRYAIPASRRRTTPLHSASPSPV